MDTQLHITHRHITHIPVKKKSTETPKKHVVHAIQHMQSVKTTYNYLFPSLSFFPHSFHLLTVFLVHCSYTLFPCQFLTYLVSPIYPWYLSKYPFPSPNCYMSMMKYINLLLFRHPYLYVYMCIVTKIISLSKSQKCSLTKQQLEWNRVSYYTS